MRKNKLFLLVFSVVMAASLSMLAGCGGGSDDVSVSVTATQESREISGTTYNYVVMTWDAVGGASSYYNVYYQQEGKASISGGSDSVSGYAFDPDSTDPFFPLKQTPSATNPDIDKKLAFTMYSYVSGNTTTMLNNFESGKKYRFGVQADFVNPDATNVNKDIVWTQYFQF